MQKSQLLDQIKQILSNGPQSIGQIAKQTKINWRTAQNFLSLLEHTGLVQSKKQSNKRIYYLKDPNNYFDIPIKPAHKPIIDTVYHIITDTCQAQNKLPTRLQVYKITWKINQKLKLNLPIGWYLQGPCCIQVYKGDENGNYEFSAQQLKVIKETVKNYCALDNLALQNHVYKEEGNQLYLIKQRVLENPDRLALLDFIKNVPKELTELATDFTRMTVLIKFMPEVFDMVWKAVALIGYRNSLNNYQKNLSDYFDQKIDEQIKEAQLTIKGIVENFVESKHSQDPVFQDWKKKRNPSDS